jgi:hypothetical protein
VSTITELMNPQKLFRSVIVKSKIALRVSANRKVRAMKPIKSLSTFFIVAVGLTASSIGGAAWAAATTQHHKVAPSSKHLYMHAPNPSDQSATRDPAKSGDAREAAIRECSGAARKYTERDWTSLVGATYSTCMTSHGQTP